MHSEKDRRKKWSRASKDKMKKNVQETLCYLTEPSPSPSPLHSTHRGITQSRQTHSCRRASALAAASARIPLLSELAWLVSSRP